MTSIFQIDAHNDMWQMLPGGVYILFQHHYTQPEEIGVYAVSVASIISVLAITMLLSAILVSLIQDWRNPGQKRASRHAFIKSHAGIYFISMLLSTFICTLGFMLSLVWAVDRTITFGTFCTVQAALKQFGNVATALWVLAIAVHTFVVVFMQKVVPNWVFWIVFVLVWLLSAAIIAAGPLIYVTEQMGPWYGISGQWCWTSDSYVMPRFTTEYFWIFLTATISFIVYILLFFKLRGNFGDGFRFTFKRRPVGPETSRVANQMLWYPVVYFFLVCPIAGCRIYEIIAIKKANLAIKMASAVLFMLSGLVNVILYTSTRNIFRLSQLLPRPVRYFFQRFLPSTNLDKDTDGFQQVKDVSPTLPTPPIFKGPSSNYGSGTESLSGGSSPIESDRYSSEKMVTNANSPINVSVSRSPIPSPSEAYQRTQDTQANLGIPSLHKSSSLLSLQSSRSFMGSKTNIGLDKSGKTVIKKPIPAARRNSGNSSSGSGSVGSRPGSRQGTTSPELNPFSSGSPASADSISPVRNVLRDLEPRRSPVEPNPDPSYRIDLKKIPVRGQSKGAVDRHDIEQGV